MHRQAFMTTIISTTAMPSVNRLPPSPTLPSTPRRRALGEKVRPTSPEVLLSWNVALQQLPPITIVTGAGSAKSLNLSQHAMASRHMREHNTRYCCIPRCSVVHTTNGPRCAFCDFSNPDRRHLKTHNTSGCAGKYCSRKEHLIDHLNNYHGLVNDSVLADQFKYTVPKKNFACGFCVSWFGSLNEQINHIDVSHWRYSEHICDWDFDKYIRGLLSQPPLNEHWIIAQASYPHVRWGPIQVKQLSIRLEEGREPPAVLVAAAIKQSNYSRSDYGHVGSMAVSGLMGPEMNTGQSIQSLQHQDALSPLPSTSEQGISTHASRMTVPVLPSQKWDEDLEDQQSPPIASEKHESPFNPMYHQPGHRPQPRSLVYSGESFMEQQCSANVPLITFPSGTLQPLEGQSGTPYSSNLNRHSQGVSANSATLPISRRMAEAHNYPPRPQTGWSHPDFQSGLSPFSQSSQISPGGQFTSPRHHSYLSTQLPRQETIDYGDTVMDADSDNTQRFMQDQGHTRAQR